MRTRDDFADAPLYLAYGVTTVLNLSGTPTILEWHKRVEAGTLLGPTIYTSGPFVNEPRVNTPEEVERDIVAQAQQGYDLIKFHEFPSTTIGLSRSTNGRNGAAHWHSAQSLIRLSTPDSVDKRLQSSDKSVVVQRFYPSGGSNVLNLR